MTGPRRGEVWWASLPPPRGSEPGYRRPVVVVQANRFNESRIRTLVVAVISSNLDLAAAPGNLRVRTEDCGLSRLSVINVSQLYTVDRSALTERTAMLPARVLNELAEGLRLVLAL